MMKMEHDMKIIDGHVHLVQYIAGTGAGESCALPETAWRNTRQGNGSECFLMNSAREW